MKRYCVAVGSVDLGHNPRGVAILSQACRTHCERSFSTRRATHYLNKFERVALPHDMTGPQPPPPPPTTSSSFTPFKFIDCQFTSAPPLWLQHSEFNYVVWCTVLLLLVLHIITKLTGRSIQANVSKWPIMTWVDTFLCQCWGDEDEHV